MNRLASIVPITGMLKMDRAEKMYELNDSLLRGAKVVEKTLQLTPPVGNGVLNESQLLQKGMGSESD